MSVSLGTVVIIRGLHRATELNGRFGKVVGMQFERLLIDVEGTGQVKAIKQENLKLPRPTRSWCHQCSECVVAGFTERGELRCPGCLGTFVEATPTVEQVREAAAFPAGTGAGQRGDAGGDAAAAQRMLAELAPRRSFVQVRPGHVVEIIHQPSIFDFSGVSPFGQSFEDLLHVLHQQEEPHGPPPASREAVSTLERFTADDSHAEQVCAVCQDQYEAGQAALRMPCGHNFHSDCLSPWLKEHNSCPTCRYELPTDDAEYEAKKRQHQQQQQQQRPAAAHDGVRSMELDDMTHA